MRMLTDEERAQLAWFARDVDEVIEADQVPDVVEVLVRRGLVTRTTNPPDDPFVFTDAINALGYLALRVDAAARAAGVLA